ncbi:MAG: hypothetical protein SO253_00465 [Bacilli bacterium]|nr:hypothetical protein [Bacilli bacterium]
MSLEQFYLYIGELIMYFQVIERDLKIIYTSITSNNFYVQYSDINNLSLGQMVGLMKEKQYFSSNEIHQLQKMKHKRNYYVHQSFLSFVDNDHLEDSVEYQEVSNKLMEDHNFFENLCIKVSNLSKQFIE